jgi:hypothetical protein
VFQCHNIVVSNAKVANGDYRLSILHSC